MDLSAAGFGASLTEVLPELRAMAESRMTDTCRITEVDATADPVWDPATGSYTQPEGEVYGPATAPYFGKCRVPKGGGVVTENGASAQSFNVGEYPLDLPADAVGIATGQTVTYLAAPYSPALVGMVFGITEPLLLSQGTKQRWKIKTNVGA